MATVSFKSARRWYPGMDRPAVPGIDLEIADGELMVLVGPSGCGKSTILRMLAGLEEIDDGQIFIGDRDVTRLPPQRRDVAMLAQNYALYPHLTVADNMAFALRKAKLKASERKARVAEAARLLHLTDHLDDLPKALSGDQRQRVAMGRAIVRRPQVFCMDEPLTNLDARLRARTRAEIARLQQDLGVTTVYVTPDQVEAMSMGDRVAVMRHGVLQQVDTPLGLYDRPANLFVAGFIGSPRMNLLSAKTAIGGGDGRTRIGDWLVPARDAATPSTGDDVVVGVRPEAWRLVSADGGGLPVVVTMVEGRDSDVFVHGTNDLEGTQRNVVVRVSARGTVRTGDVLHLSVDAADVHLFDAGTGERFSA